MRLDIVINSDELLRDFAFESVEKAEITAQSISKYYAVSVYVVIYTEKNEREELSYFWNGIKY